MVPLRRRTTKKMKAADSPRSARQIVRRPARSQRSKLEALVDSKLVPSDAALNDYFGLKKLATFRDQEKKRKRSKGKENASAAAAAEE
jgi:hypothetical protein